MSRTAVIVSSAEDSRALCRLCMIYHEYFVNIFIPNSTFRICAEEAIHDLLSLKVAVGDGLPSNICYQCARKLMEFRDFKDMCLKTAAELRKYDLDNFLTVSKVKDEAAADEETFREGTSQENSFLNDIQVRKEYITTPDELAIENVSHAKEELWSSENAFLVKEEVNDGEHRIEGFVQVNALTSLAVDPLAVNTKAVKGETQDSKGAAGEGSSLGDTSPHNHIRVTEVFVPMPDQLAIGNVRYADGDSRQTEVIVKEEIGEGLECSENDVPVVSLSNVNVDPLAVDTTRYADGDSRQTEVIVKEEIGEGLECSENDVPVVSLSNVNVDPLAVDTTRYADGDSRQTEVIVKEEIGEGLECSENDVPVVSLSNVNVDPLAVDTTVDPFNNIGGLAQEPEKESDKFGVHIQGISQNQVHNNPSCDPVQEENLQLKYFKPNSFVEDCFPEGTLKKQKKNIKYYASSKKFSQLNDRARPVRNDEGEQLCHQAKNASYPTEYICNYCSTRYLEKKSLAVHIKRHMDGMRSARISLKDFQPRFSQNLSVKTFKCNECGKMFNRSCNLTRHSRIHSGVKTFKCNECGKMFTTRGDLNRHSVVHTGVKPFKCKECGKMFAISNYLKTHSVVHTGVKLFKCNECGKTFTTKSNLNKHSVVHNGVKRFKCEECGKMFARSGDLKTHSVVHTGVKLFKCNECGKMFTTSSHLRRHSHIHSVLHPL